LSLKPPWKQKNPLMEKVCQAYHKQTAPAEAIKFLEDLRVKDEDTGKSLEKEVVYNGKTKKKKKTIVFFLRGDDPEVVASINTSGGSITDLEVSKLGWDRFGVYYKGERIMELGRGQIGGYQTKTY